MRRVLRSRRRHSSAKLLLSANENQASRNWQQYCPGVFREAHSRWFLTSFDVQRESRRAAGPFPMPNKLKFWPKMTGQRELPGMLLRNDDRFRHSQRQTRNLVTGRNVFLVREVESRIRPFGCFSAAYRTAAVKTSSMSWLVRQPVAGC